MFSSDDTEKSGSVRYVKFSGKGSEFYKWKVKTLALPPRKNFAQYLKEDRSKDANFEKGNADEWDQYVLILIDVQFNMILEAEENAHTAWKILLTLWFPGLVIVAILATISVLLVVFTSNLFFNQMRFLIY